MAFIPDQAIRRMSELSGSAFKAYAHLCEVRHHESGVAKRQHVDREARGWSRPGWYRAVAELTEKGWIEKAKGGHTLLVGDFAPVVPRATAKSAPQESQKRDFCAPKKSQKRDFEPEPENAKVSILNQKSLNIETAYKETRQPDNGCLNLEGSAQAPARANIPTQAPLWIRSPEGDPLVPAGLTAVDIHRVRFPHSRLSLAQMTTIADTVRDLALWWQITGLPALAGRGEQIGYLLDRYRSAYAEKHAPDTEIPASGDPVTAYEIAFPRTVLTNRDRRQIRERARDPAHWKTALDYWRSNKYRPESVGRLLDKCEELTNGTTQQQHAGSRKKSNREIIAGYEFLNEYPD